MFCGLLPQKEVVPWLFDLNKAALSETYLLAYYILCIFYFYLIHCCFIFVLLHFNQMMSLNFLLIFFCCRVSIQRKGYIIMVYFHICGIRNKFATVFSYSMCYSGFRMEHCRYLVDKATWINEVRFLKISKFWYDLWILVVV